MKLISAVKLHISAISAADSTFASVGESHCTSSVTVYLLTKMYTYINHINH